MRGKKRSFMDRWLDWGKFPGSELGERETGFRHRNYYHKHFMGYTEIRRVNEKGRVVIERRYTAPYQRHSLTDCRWMLLKAAYALGALATTGLFLGALVQRIPSNSAALAAAPGFLSGLFLVLLWMAVFTYVSAPRNMTLWEHHSGKSKIELFTRLAAAGFLLTAAAKVVFVCTRTEPAWSGELGSIVMLILAAVPPVLIFLCERSMGYAQLENPAAVEEEERYEIM